MKDLDGNKIKAKTMTQEQAQLVLERMQERSGKKIYKRALEFAIDVMAGPAGGNRKARAAKA